MTKIVTLRDAVQELRTKMWRTAGARFNCHRRMKYRNAISAFTISTLSVYLIGISVSQKVYSIGEICPNLDNHLTFISIVGAVFIIVLSLIEWASDFSVKADRLFENANKIKELRFKLERSLDGEVSENELKATFNEVAQEYESLTNGHHPNHDPVDDFLFRAQNPKEPHPSFNLNKSERVWARVWWGIVTYWMYVIALIAPIVAIAGVVQNSLN